jgi:hypothetical protein
MGRGFDRKSSENKQLGDRVEAVTRDRLPEELHSR